MSDNTAPDWLAPLRFTGRVILSVLLILWTLLDSILRSIFRPLFDWLGRLRFFDWLGSLFARLPPYVALAVFAVPFIIIEPIKAFALYWFGIGHFVEGGALYVIAHLASLLIVERIYHAAHEPLMRIGWFKRLMTWLDGLRRLVLDWAKSTAVWQWSAGVARQVKQSVAAAIRP
ncbi:MAG TPA: hypothetical protein VHB74_08985 [Devosia sp.]|nr:hypothetical protein [Devosia sp.]